MDFDQMLWNAYWEGDEAGVAELLEKYKPSDFSLRMRKRIVEIAYKLDSEKVAVELKSLLDV